MSNDPNTPATPAPPAPATPATTPAPPPASTPAKPAGTSGAGAPGAATAVADARAAAVGAQAVAEAVRKAVDVALGAAQSTAANQASGLPGLLEVSGSAGGPFTIRGVGFGASGTLTVGGLPVQTTAWGNDRIKGTFPANIKSGTEIVVDSGDGKVQKGFFGTAPVSTK